MSRRRAIQTRLRTLDEMAHIMDSMKTLALLETRKLAHYLDTQQRVVRGLEEAAAAFIGAYPACVQTPAYACRLWLVLGSEHGFCGDFNDRLRRLLSTAVAAADGIIVVGRKLAAQLNADPRVRLAINGPAIAEEVDAVLSQLVSRLQQLQNEAGPCALNVLGYDETSGRIETRAVLPPFRQLPVAHGARGYPPRLYLPPAEFFDQLLEQYLFAVLHARFYASLMMENHQRMEHLDGALRHLSRTTARLQLKNNYLRQEEITEELEEVLLGAQALGNMP